jgi:SAM-dependent methyltransferase
LLGRKGWSERVGRRLTLIPNLEIAQWSFWLALKARLPLWKLEAWRALGALINSASALAPEGGSSRDRVLRAAVTPARQLGETPIPVPLSTDWLRRAAKQAIARNNRPDLAELLRADETARIAAFWDKNVGRHREPFAHWESPPPIAEALNVLVSGESWMGPSQWFMTNYGPFGLVAELGCGDGVLTHYLLHDHPNLKVDAYDLSEASLDRSRALIATLNGGADRCRLLRIDLNTEALPQRVYDAVLTTGCMHHIESLDFCFRNIRQALKPNGLLWLNDYVGPNQFQWSDTQMRLADELLAIVPRPWRLRDRVSRFDSATMRDMDPSEAVAPQHIPAALRAHFEIVQTWARGGTLLAPIFGSGCLDIAMAASEEGVKILAAMFRAEQELIRTGALSSDNYLYIARPRPEADRLVHAAFEPHASPFFRSGQLGIKGDLDTWAHLNEIDAFQSVVARDGVAPFPPTALMHRTSGLGRDSDFAAHGAAILRALAASSPEPLDSYRSVLDFGVGVGRLARMFKGFDGRYAGVDIDELHVHWIKENLPWVDVHKTEPRRPLPFPSSTFDAVFSISVFTHMNESDHLFYLAELRRVTVPGARLFLTVAGERVLQRAQGDTGVMQMLATPSGALKTARAALHGDSGFFFVRQEGHLTSSAYEYGIAFVSETYIKQRWSEYFDVETIALGGIHDFQDIAVLRRPVD